jgi:two-component system, cell cycle response regulator
VEPAILAAGAGSLARWLALAERMRELHESSQRDPLTGLWNRRYFEQALTQRLQEARRHQSPVTLMLYDIDNFKTYNDRCGHRAGDEILRETARLMLGAVRRQDIVARIGGDEFAVVFWDAEPPRRPGSTHPHTVRAAAERFQRAVHEHGLSRLGQEAPERLTVSAGLASFPQDGQTVDELFDRADRMLMQGKAQGKNVLTFGAGVREARVGRPS